jgi:TolB-like protein
VAELFISYSKSNRPQALALAEELRERGFSVWIDQGGIRGAKEWSAEIVEAIDACSTLLLLISSASIISRNVAKEVHLASEKGRNILPVMIEKVTLPSNFEYSLAGIQRVYYHDRPAIFRALETLHGIAVTEELPRVRTEEDLFVRVAVLPFDDISPQHDNQWFADGMMDELISTLGTIDKMKIPSRSDVLHYRGHQKKSREIASELGVRYLIEGAVRKAGEKIRINASLTDTLRGEQLWTNKFDGSFDDVFAFQELVSKSIMQALKLQLEPREIEQIETRPTENVEAYELYLKGRTQQYYNTKESYLRALDLYDRAAVLDPKFERAQIGVASICCAYYREYSKNHKWLKRAEESLAKAEAINGETSKTLYIQGMIEWLKGDDQAAIATLTQSGELDRKNTNAFNVLGVIHLENRNYSAAAEAFRRVTELVESTANYFNFLSALDQNGECELRMQVAQRALPVFDRYLLIEPGDQNAAVSRAFILLWVGRKEEATQAADLLRERDDLTGPALHNLGALYAKLDQPRLYLILLRKAIDRGYREIEQTRNSQFEINDQEIQREFQIILHKLEELVEREKKA